MKKLKLMLLSLVVACCSFAIPVNATIENTFSLQDAINELEDGGTYYLEDDLELNYTVLINKNITIDGNGFAIYSYSDQAFLISNETNENINVKFTNLNIYNYAENGGCIRTSNAKINLTFDGVNLMADESEYSAPLILFGSEEDRMKCDIVNGCNLFSGSAGAALMVFVPIDLTIDEGDLNGYSALYFGEGSSGSKVDINASSLNGTARENDKFGLINFEDKDIELNINDSVLYSDIAENSEYYTIFMSDNGEIKGNKIHISGESFVETSDEEKALFTNSNEDNLIIVNKSVTSTINGTDDYPNPDEICYHENADFFEKVDEDCKYDGVKTHYECNDCGAHLDENKNEVEYDDLLIPATGNHEYKNGQCITCGDDDPSYTGSDNGNVNNGDQNNNGNQNGNDDNQNNNGNLNDNNQNNNGNQNDTSDKNPTDDNKNNTTNDKVDNSDNTNNTDKSNTNNSNVVPTGDNSMIELTLLGIITSLVVANNLRKKIVIK